MAEFDIVCQDCGEHFKAVSKLARYCRVCRNKRNNESKKKSLIKRYLKERCLMPEKPKQPELPKQKEPAKKPQYSFKPAKCPADCWYRQTISGSVPLCGYVLIEDELRGCDPGPGCKRYVGRNKNLEQTKHRKVTWDVDGGKKLWQAGWKDNMIAKVLRTRPENVRSYRVRVWEKETVSTSPEGNADKN